MRSLYVSHSAATLPVGTRVQKIQSALTLLPQAFRKANQETMGQFDDLADITGQQLSSRGSSVGIYLHSSGVSPSSQVPTRDQIA